MTVVAAPGRSGGPRVGLVVGKSVGNAVKRNRVKRRLRHAIRTISLEPDMDYVVIGGSGVIEARYRDLRNWLQRAADALR